MIDLLVRRFVKNSEQTDDPAVRRGYGTFAGVVGILLNLLLFAIKFFAGILTGSIAVTADAFNNLSDAGSSVVTLIGFRLAGAEADKDHPFGHGRVEYLSGLVVSMAILLVGFELLKSSVGKILHPEKVTFGLLPAAILTVSVCVKLWMCHFNRKLSKRIDSAAMAATATDSLSDAAATAAVLLGMLAGHFFSLRIDGWIGVLVALFILRAGWSAAKDTIDPLLGQAPDPKLVRDIEAQALSHPQVVGIHDLVIHDYGPGRRMMSFHAEVPQDADFLEAHDVIDTIEREMEERFRIETSIHMDPIAVGDERTETLREQVAGLMREIDAEMTIHDFRITPGPQLTNLIFDVVVPHHCRMSNEEITAAVQEKIRTLGESYYAVIHVDRPYVSR